MDEWANKIQYVYLAGILDGEGSVMIRKSTYRLRNKKYKDCVNPSYSPRIGIKNISKHPLMLMKKVFGGHLSKEKKIYQSKSGFLRNKLMWCYNAEHKIAYEICRILQPYLLIKHNQVKLVLELENIKKMAFKDRDKSNNKFYGKPYKEKYIKKFECLYLEVKKLNGH